MLTEQQQVAGPERSGGWSCRRDSTQRSFFVKGRFIAYCFYLFSQKRIFMTKILSKMLTSSSSNVNHLRVY